MKMFNLNLRRFDVQTTTMSGYGNDLSPEMKTYYDKTLIDEAEPNLVHRQFGQSRPIPKNGGKTIEFRKFSSLPNATTPITEGVTPAGNKLNVSTITAEVEQYGDYITQSDMLEMTSIDPTVVEATRLLGGQAGRTLDVLCRDAIQAGTNVYYCPKRTGGTVTEITSRAALDGDCKMHLDDVFMAAAILEANNAPKIDGMYVAIIHPFVAKDLKTEAGNGWMEVMKYAKPENILQGEIGAVGGVRFVQSSQAKIRAGAGAAYGDGKYSVFSTLFLGAEAYGNTEISGMGLETIVKQRGSAGTSDPLNQRSSVGWKATAVTEILVQEYMLRVESTSCMPTSASN